jgi:thioredoxin 1
MKVRTIYSISDFEKVIEGPALTVIDFWASWCGPCLQIAPRIEEFARNYPYVNFYKVDVDQAHDLATKANITAMPTFKFYKKGHLLDTVIGADLSAIKERIHAHTANVCKR